MFDKLRKATNPSSKAGNRSATKKWTAILIFGAIIVVFILWGVRPEHYGEMGGGVAAVVNDAPISINQFRTRVENIEQNAREQLNQFPAEQRAATIQKMREDTLRNMVQYELIYQAANDTGVSASNGEVVERIAELPFLQENGRFARDRYRNYLAYMRMTPEEFEAQERKQAVIQRLQQLFVGAASPSQEEIRRNSELAQQKLKLRFAQIRKEDLAKSGFVNDSDIQSFATTNQDEIKKYYEDNKVQYSKGEAIRARHILVRVDKNRPESAAQAEKTINDLKKQATPANFAALAAKYSDDPMSKSKGGDLGEFDRDMMPPEFNAAAFSATPGKVSDPFQTMFGWHLVLVESKKPASTQAFADVKDGIARQLYGRKKEGELVERLRKTVETGNKAAVDALVSKTGSKWEETGEFDLSSQSIPKIGSNPALLNAVMKHGRNPGLINRVVDQDGALIVADLTSWKSAPAASTAQPEGVNMAIAYRRSNGILEDWMKAVEAKASIQLNPRISQR